jgi:hypothetical protein
MWMTSATNRQWDIRGAESIRGHDEPIRTYPDVLQRDLATAVNFCTSQMAVCLLGEQVNASLWKGEGGAGLINGSSDDNSWRISRMKFDYPRNQGDLAQTRPSEAF